MIIYYRVQVFSGSVLRYIAVCIVFYKSAKYVRGVYNIILISQTFKTCQNVVYFKALNIEMGVLFRCVEILEALKG